MADPVLVADPVVADLVLVPFSRRHLAALEPALDDPEILRHTRIPEPPPRGFARTWLGRYEAGRRDGTREAFAIEDGAGTFLGLALAPRIERDARTVELGYLVVPAARGRGVATAALRLITEWALTELGALRIELLIAVDNAASRRVAERVGYVREGVLRSLHFKGDLRQDTELWSLLPADRGERPDAGAPEVEPPTRPARPG